MDFSAEDRIDFNQYNHILWKGLMGNKPYPETPTGLDLRNNRAELLRNYHASQESKKLQSDAETAPSDIEPERRRPVKP